MSQGIIVGLVGIVFLLMWVTLLLDSIHQEILAIMKSLSSASVSTPNPKKLKDSKDIADSENDEEDAS